MSLVASDRAPLGVAQTLCSLPPILILPVVVWVHKERVSARAVVGAVIAVAGTALLFVKPA
jgi:drug/metabolite transporter (DMT)-like permease